MPRYQILVDDNFHYQDAEHRYEDRTCDRLEDALSRCRQIVDDFLLADFRAGMTADALYERYTAFGEDPFIVVIGGTDEAARFSAWDYAKQRCRAICEG